MNWINNISNLGNCLKSLSVRDEAGNETDFDSAFTKWKDRTVQVRENRKTVYLIGNGASASMASHFAADLAKNGQVHTEVFTDLSLITAVANDINYESVFAEPLRWRMTEGDMPVAISSSGNSPNVLAGCKTAVSLGGYVITLSAMKPDNRLRSSGNLNFLCACRDLRSGGNLSCCNSALLDGSDAFNPLMRNGLFFKK